MIVFVVAKTCFMSMKVVAFAAIATVVAIATPSSAKVKVPDEPEVLVTTMFVTM